MTGRTQRSRPRQLQRAALVVAGAVHLPYPLAFLWAVVVPQADGHSEAGAALLAAPVMFAVTAAVVGPLTWRSWNEGRLAPWVLAGFLAFETWLWRNGTRTSSWEEPGAAERLATFQTVAHATALLALAGTTVAVAFVRGRHGTTKVRDVGLPVRVTAVGRQAPEL